MASAGRSAGAEHLGLGAGNPLRRDLVSGREDEPSVDGARLVGSFDGAAPCGVGSIGGRSGTFNGLNLH
jgi:hypothetical protein